MEYEKYKIEILNDIIKNRRSMKPARMVPGSISDAVIETLLENANWAPTHLQTEPWRFTVFTGDGRQKLAAFQSQLYQETLSEVEFQAHKYQRLKQNPLSAACVIGIAMHRDPRERLPEVEEIAAVACAVQNMHLTATGYGLVALWSSGFPTYTEAVKPFLGLSEADRCLGFLYVGYPPDGEWPVMQRQPVTDKARWIRA